MNRNLTKKILRALLIFGLPVFATIYVYYYFRINYSPDLGGGELTLVDLKKKITEDLNKKEQNLQFFNPLLEFGSKWLSYDLSIKNEMKVAVLASEPKYSEHEATLDIQSSDESQVVVYGQEKRIVNGAKKNQIFDKIQQLNYSISPSQNAVIAYPNTIVRFQTNPSLGQVYFDVSLNTSQWWLILLEILLVWAGILLVLKEAIIFVLKGFE